MSVYKMVIFDEIVVLMRAVVRSCDGREAQIDLDSSARVFSLKKLARALLLSSDNNNNNTTTTEVRLLRGRRQAQDDERVDEGPYVLVQVGEREKQVDTNTDKDKAASLEDIALATGAEIPPVAAAPTGANSNAPAPEEVQNRIRGFMNSLFMGAAGENEEEEEEREEAPPPVPDAVPADNAVDENAVVNKFIITKEQAKLS